ncbi:blood vessel epicardial substance-like [Homarus americanus]|uniref:blood vessel epicardial substance-like n=1 Tax=Homarus americanus TaxID=6706 RepID=UPI001C43FB81|nr:blood vessel epicardial substance-like [Homarus americanus]
MLVTNFSGNLVVVSPTAFKLVTEVAAGTTTEGTLYNDSGGQEEGDADVSWAEGYNNSLLLLLQNNFTVLNQTAVNETVGLAGRLVYCKEWPGASLTLFQVANFFCLLAFLVPHNFRMSALVMRVVLCVGILLFSLWAVLDICAVDILAWNLSFLMINTGHVLYLTYSVWPPRVHKDLVDLYDKVFRPLKVNRQNFRHLVREATVVWVEPGDTYAMEDVTPADERLSILVSGKLRVTCDSTHLHYILPNQFIDSPEWEACADDLMSCSRCVLTGVCLQVTILAEERSMYLCWTRSRLRHLLHVRPFLRAIIYNLVGKDITTKLYSLNEQLGVGALGSEGVRGVGAQDVWRGVVQRSMSVDNVHTGTKGFVRSLAWRTSNRRTSTGYCESVRSSPGRSRGSHASDPVLKDPQGGPWGGAAQHASTSHRYVATHSPRGLESPLAGAAAAAGDTSSLTALVSGASGSSGKRTSRENVVRCVVPPRANVVPPRASASLPSHALDNPHLLETSV